MNTIFATITEDEKSNASVYEKAGEILRAGGLVAFPTETVYGLGGNALNSEAAGKTYAAKGRPSDNPLIVHIADFDAVYEICEEVPQTAKDLAAAFWPGPMTLVMKKKAIVPDSITGGLGTVAVRLPAHPVALQLIRTSGVYISAPSANTSGKPSPTTAEHVRFDLDGKIDMIIDGGPVEIGIESTVIDVTGEVPTVLRPGFVTPEMIREVCGCAELDKAIIEGAPADAVPKAPGMKYKHYAPGGELTVVESISGNMDAVVETINRLSAEKRAGGHLVGILATNETLSRYEGDTVLSVGDRKEEISVSAHLFARLREFDDAGTDIIYSESFSRDNMGLAIMNRLMKAAGGRIVRIE